MTLESNSTHSSPKLIPSYNPADYVQGNANQKSSGFFKGGNCSDLQILS